MGGYHLRPSDLQDHQNHPRTTRTTNRITRTTLRVVLVVLWGVLVVLGVVLVVLGVVLVVLACSERSERSEQRSEPYNKA